jgi:N-glycosylase/DNA lyase
MICYIKTLARLKFAFVALVLMESPLFLLYASKKADIKKRLEELDKVKYESGDRIFAELCFCLCTPQTKALAANKAIKELEKTGLLLSGNEEQISEILKKSGVRFHNNKAAWIILARNQFTRAGQMKIKGMLNTDDITGLRNWLADNVKGLGMKEASHFLRNIGHGQDLAIIDRHILTSAINHKIIKEIPESISKQRYLEIEQQLKRFANLQRISLQELDMVWWSEFGSLPLEEMK